MKDTQLSQLITTTGSLYQSGAGGQGLDAGVRNILKYSGLMSLSKPDKNEAKLLIQAIAPQYVVDATPVVSELLSKL